MKCMKRRKKEQKKVCQSKQALHCTMSYEMKYIMKMEILRIVQIL